MSDNGPQFLLRQSRSLNITPQLRQAIGLLRFSNLGLSSFLSAQAATNPFIVVKLGSSLRQTQVLSKGDVDKSSASIREFASNSGSDSGGRGVDFLAAPDVGLYDHVRQEADLCLRDRRQRQIADFFIEALESSGWLGRPLEQIADDAGCSPDEAEAVLAILQTIEPAGIFARSLAECLRLQAVDRGVLTAGLDCVLANLELLARGDMKGLARLCGEPPQAIMSYLGMIRTFDPKPGASLDPAPTVARPPDLIVSRTDGAWKIDLNRSTLPTIEVRDGADARSRLERSEQDWALLDAAKWLARAVERRHATTLKIAAEVVRRQASFLAKGRSQLVPMSLSEIATATEVHQSTVSRVTAGMTVATPHGTVPMRGLFSVALPSKGHKAGVSAAAVREEIRHLISNETPNKPVSDQKIAEHFAAQGISLARRTVAKYREALRIPGSGERQRRQRIGTDGR